MDTDRISEVMLKGMFCAMIGVLAVLVAMLVGIVASVIWAVITGKVAVPAIVFVITIIFLAGTAGAWRYLGDAF